MRILAWPYFNAINPYTELLYRALISRGQEVENFSLLNALRSNFEILHIHWPDYQLAAKSAPYAALRCLAFFAVLAIIKLRGARIVWTVHNICSHEHFHPRLEIILWSLFLPLLDGAIYLTETSRCEAVAAHPALGKVPAAVIQHGDYRSIYPDTLDRAGARARLGLLDDVAVALAFGMVRPYKRLADLIQVFKRTRRDNLRLLIAGMSPDASLTRELHAAAAGDARILLNLDFVADEEVQVWLKAADLLVLNHLDILNSGALLLGLSFDRPVLAPRLAVLEELMDFFGTQWICLFQEELSPDILENALSWALADKPSLDAKLDEIAWSNLARQTLTFYEEILG